MKKSQLSHAIRSVSPLGAARGMSVRQEPTLSEEEEEEDCDICRVSTTTCL